MTTARGRWWIGGAVLVALAGGAVVWTQLGVEPQAPQPAQVAEDVPPRDDGESWDAYLERLVAAQAEGALPEARLLDAVAEALAGILEESLEQTLIQANGDLAVGEIQFLDGDTVAVAGPAGLATLGTTRQIRGLRERIPRASRRDLERFFGARPGAGPVAALGPGHALAIDDHGEYGLLPFDGAEGRLAHAHGGRAPACLRAEEALITATWDRQHDAPHVRFYDLASGEIARRVPGRLLACDHHRELIVREGLVLRERERETPLRMPEGVDPARARWHLMDGAALAVESGRWWLVRAGAPAPHGEGEARALGASRIAVSRDGAIAVLGLSGDPEIERPFPGLAVVAASPDGSLLAIGGQSGGALWRPGAAELAPFTDEAVDALGVGPRGELLAWGGPSSPVRVLRVADGSVVRADAGPSLPGRIHVSADSRVVVLSGDRHLSVRGPELPTSIPLRVHAAPPARELEVTEAAPDRAVVTLDGARHRVPLPPGTRVADAAGDHVVLEGRGSLEVRRLGDGHLVERFESVERGHHTTPAPRLPRLSEDGSLLVAVLSSDQAPDSVALYALGPDGAERRYVVPGTRGFFDGDRLVVTLPGGLFASYPTSWAAMRRAACAHLGERAPAVCR